MGTNKSSDIYFFLIEGQKYNKYKCKKYYNAMPLYCKKVTILLVPWNKTYSDRYFYLIIFSDYVLKSH